MSVATVNKFLEYVDDQDQDGCWEWTAARSGAGYGNFVANNGKNISAHRYSYAVFVGPIPEGLALDHLCRNRACVNPDHLEPVTHRENTRRGLRKDLRETCDNGHPWVPENLVPRYGSDGEGRHRCRACYEATRAKIDARRSKQGKCVDCGDSIGKFAKRCRSCAATSRNLGRCKP